ncbi:MAG: Asp-tRNA(Asn)/Glu-tRNA(Gln) amidotransferase subunit GatC [Verrucomicrobia bacterium]|nr:Asp-tRNA(Asn)/Glu-tRNA(Gln) amidotransferase subunit GatC [Verrucomicrobiota bacterium]
MSAPKFNVSDVATLARLALTKEEAEKFTAQLGQVLGHMEALAKIPTDNVPEVHPPDHPVLRKDVPSPSLSAEAALSNAPAQANDLIVVPKIVE